MAEIENEMSANGRTNKARSTCDEHPHVFRDLAAYTEKKARHPLDAGFYDPDPTR